MTGARSHSNTVPVRAYGFDGSVDGVRPNPNSVAVTWREAMALVREDLAVPCVDRPGEAFPTVLALELRADATPARVTAALGRPI